MRMRPEASYCYNQYGNDVRAYGDYSVTDLSNRKRKCGHEDDADLTAKRDGASLNTLTYDYGMAQDYVNVKPT